MPVPASSFIRKLIHISAVMFIMGRCRNQSESVKNKVHKWGSIKLGGDHLERKL
jgi:hypothetical protein